MKFEPLINEEMDLGVVLELTLIRIKTIQDDALEDDILNDEYNELNKMVAICRNLLKIKQAISENNPKSSYKLYKLENIKPIEKETAWMIALKEFYDN